MKRLGEFIIERRIGRGAMADVYRAVNPQTHQRVAIKVPHFHTPEEREQVLQEVRLSVQLVHPAIVRVYEVRPFGDELAIVMELVEGESLRQLLQREGGLGVDQVLSIASQIASALSEAHAHGVLHRDIKPENIMVLPDGSVRVMDFGIAERVDPNALSTRQRVAGTALYMSPEQAMGASLDERSDLYSLGAVMYEMVTGHPPFEGDNLISLLYRHINESPLPPRREVPDLPAELNQIILRLLRKDPSERFPSAAALQEALEACRSHRERDLLESVEAVEEIWQSRERLHAQFVGREAEMARLQAAWERTRQGQGGTLVIEGEQGIGKTRLVEEFLAVAPEMLALRGQGRRDAVTPYLPIVQALRSQGTEALPVDLEDWLESRSAGDTSESAEVAHRRLLDGLTEAFVAIAKEQPTCLILDDLQDCDSGTLELLERLTVSAREIPLLILIGYTPGELESARGSEIRLAETLNALESEGRIERLLLPRLNRGEVSQLVDSLFELADFDERFLEQLYRETGGNPLFVLETLEWLRSEQIIAADPLGVWSLTQSPESIEIPAHVTELLRRRLEPLTPEERHLLQCASVVEGETFDLNLLTSLTGISGLPLLELLGTLERVHRLIVPEGSQYRFDHIKLKQLLYEALSPEQRRQYHLQLARKLESQDAEANVYRIAYHYERAEQTDKAREFLLKAARSDERLFANERAVDYYQRALRFIPSDVPEHLQVLQRVAWIQSHLLGEVEQAIEAYDQISRLSEALNDRAAQAEAIKQLGNLYAVRGQWEASDRAYEQSRRLFAQVGDQREVGNIWINMGMNAFETGRPQEALDCFAKALEIAQQIADVELRADAHRCFGMVYAFQQDIPRAIHYYRLSIEEYEQIGASRYLAQTQMHLGMIYSSQGEVTLADQYFARSEQTARRTGDIRFLGFVCVNRAELLAEIQPERAKQLCNDALNLLRKADDQAGLIAVYRIYGRVYRALHQWELAQRCLHTSIELAQQGGNQLDVAEGYRDLGYILLESGQPEQARGTLEQAIRVYQELGVEEPLQEIQQRLAVLGEG